MRGNLWEKEENPREHRFWMRCSALVSPASGAARRRAEWINRFRKETPVFVAAVDLPSGIDSRQRQDFRGAGSAGRCDADFPVEETGICCSREGELLRTGFFRKIGREELWQKENPPRRSCFEEDFCAVKERLTDRPQNSHKGSYGRALLIAGSRDYAGAAVLCASAALKTGTGLLSVLTNAQPAQALNAALPEVMTPYGPGRPAGEDALALLENALPGKPAWESAAEWAITPRLLRWFSGSAERSAAGD